MQIRNSIPLGLSFPPVKVLALDFLVAGTSDASAFPGNPHFASSCWTPPGPMVLSLHVGLGCFLSLCLPLLSLAVMLLVLHRWLELKVFGAND